MDLPDSLEPTGFFNMVHFHPILAAVLPIYWLRPEATTLLRINAGAVAVTAWPSRFSGERPQKVRFLALLQPRHG